MDILKIYLAGKMSGLTFNEMNEWRRELELKLRALADVSGCKVKVINPVKYYNFQEVKHQSEREVKDYDLKLVNSSDVIIVNLDGLQTSDGTKYELHDARKSNIPVIAFGNKRLYDNLHSWTQDNITRIEEDINDVVVYIKDFYMS